MYRNDLKSRDRTGAIVAVAIIHAGLGVALLSLSGPAALIEDGLSTATRLIDITPEPPPVVEIEPIREQAPEEEGEASPPNIRSEATPVVAPKPRVVVPVENPVVASPTPNEGADPTQGAAEVPGPGTGAGGVGTGTGAGGSGSGPGGGGGGIGRPPQLVRGNITRRDYPRELRSAPTPRGVIEMEFTIGTDGRVRNCRAIRSSGSPVLDASTCQLVEQRYVYRPALDRQGRPTPIVGRMQRWWWGDR